MNRNLDSVAFPFEVQKCLNSFIATLYRNVATFNSNKIPIISHTHTHSHNPVKYKDWIMFTFASIIINLVFSLIILCFFFLHLDWWSVVLAKIFPERHECSRVVITEPLNANMISHLPLEHPQTMRCLIHREIQLQSKHSTSVHFTHATTHEKGRRQQNMFSEMVSWERRITCEAVTMLNIVLNYFAGRKDEKRFNIKYEKCCVIFD